MRFLDPLSVKHLVPVLNVLFTMVPVHIAQNVTVREQQQYSPGPCTEADVFKYLSPVTLATCQEECDIRSHCKSINYYRPMYLCKLRSKEDISEDAIDVQLGNVCLAIAKVNWAPSVSIGVCWDSPCSRGEKCLQNNNDPDQFECVKSECGQPSEVEHAFLRSPSTRSVGSSNSYGCQQGYMAIGQTTIRCEETGLWSPVSFTCYPLCSKTGFLSGNARIISTSTYRPVVNTTAVLESDTGDTLYTDVRLTVTCQADGSWITEDGNGFH